MDFGVFDGLLCSENTINNNSLISNYNLDQNPKSYGFKQQESSSVSVSAIAHNQDDLLKRSDRSSVCSVSDNMINFSSPNIDDNLWNEFAGFGCGGAFTSSQWMELEHQALIYKYMIVNAPVPLNLLIPIRRAVESTEFSSFPATNLRHTAYGWGGFHLGLSNSLDSEPGRCRRTDGKKWRCSRDAVAYHKYCERHMNRGRYRSRKHVEGQSGHSVSNGLTAAAAKFSSLEPIISTSVSTSVSHFNHQNQHQLNRNLTNKENMMSEKIQDTTCHSMVSPSPIACEHVSISIPSELGFVCSDIQNPISQFMDDWQHPNRTQLSISIPSNAQNLNLSPLKMGLGVNDSTNTKMFDDDNGDDRSQRVNWENLVSGPLGEVLNHSMNNSRSSLNLMTGN
ncbi:hypothetical protein E3N88_22314 [Mikania micrantha]|uniref:Growth-regulating factor n=1 Tax=Mikania micrantha TaxID=192012 RepID=A0A5N6NBK9_9ASTR|nr:hypothetical protein E3N88_22314 [Mikania micrantha]